LIRREWWVDPPCHWPVRISGFDPLADIAEGTALAREYEARRRTVREQSTLGINEAAFCRTDTAAAVEDFTFCSEPTRLKRDGSDERNLELERRTANAFFEHRLDGKAHAAVEKGRCKAAMLA
jgi:hypothetical protein